MATPTSYMQVRLAVNGSVVNYCLNPSAEDGSGATPTNASAVAGATISRQTTITRQVTVDSSYAFRVQTASTNQGLQLTTGTLPNATTYVSAWIRGTFTAANIRFKIGSTTVTPTLYETDGAWTWFVTDDTPFTGAQASGQTAVQILHTTTGADFYVDDVVVAGTLTTAFHGSYAGCEWSGIAHQSTSTLYGRLSDGTPNLAAGQIYDLANSWLVVSSLLGAGLPEIELQEQDTVDRGRIFQSAQLNARTLVLQGVTLKSTSIANLHSVRSTLIDYVPPGEKFVFRYRGNPTFKGGTNDISELETVYVKGLEGNWNLPLFEQTVLTLKAHDPLFRASTDTATALNLISSTTLSFALRRTATGWEIPGGGLGPNVVVYALACSPKGHIFAGGQFGNDNLKGWNGSTWADCGVMTGTKVIHALAFDPSGTVLYVGGEFTNMGGVTCNNIAKYTLPASGVSGGTWAAMGGTPGTNNRVRAIVTVPSTSGHDVYAFGLFTTAGGSSANYAAKWNGSAWSTLGPNTASANGYVRCAVYDGNRYIYFGGEFTTFGTMSTPSAPSVSNTTGTLANGQWTYKILLRSNTGRTALSAASATGTSSTGKVITLPNTAGCSYIEIFRSQTTTGFSPWYYLTSVPRGTTTFTDDGSLTYNTNLPDSSFTTATDGTRTAYVGKYDTLNNCFEYVGQTGMGAMVKTLALAPDGVTLYAGGSFIVADSAQANKVAQYNGYIWSAMGDTSTGGGVNGGDVESLLVLPTGEVAVGGKFTSLYDSLVGSLGVSLAYWAPGALGGSGVWTHADVTFPSSTTVYAVMLDHNRRLWFGYDTSGSGTLSASTTVTQSGMAGAFLSYPRLYIQGPGVLRYLENVTTGHRLWFNLTVGTDEVVTLDLRRGYKTITSSVGGATRISRFVTGDLGDFGLRAGANTILVYYTGTSGNAAIKMSDQGLRISADK